MRASQPIPAQADRAPGPAPHTQHVDGEATRHPPDAHDPDHQGSAGSDRLPEDEPPGEGEEQAAERRKPKLRPPRPLRDLLTYEEYEEIPFTD